MCFLAKIRKRVHILKCLVNRSTAPALPYMQAQKVFGNVSEDYLYDELLEKLPYATIVPNVCLDNVKAKGEIDFLIIFQKRVFVLELKSWKGCIQQDGNEFHQIKESQYGKEYSKAVPSPFKQIDRNVYLIKSQFPNIWFEKIVLFLNSDSVNIKDEHVWVTNIDDLVKYIINFNGKPNQTKYIDNLLRHIHSYDLIYSEARFGNKKEHCIIVDDSLTFQFDGKTYFKKDISEIEIQHKLFYDDVNVKLKNNDSFSIQTEEQIIKYIKNGKELEVALNKLDYIRIG